MKIGILTYHRAINYGAVLQAFALKHYVQGLGHQVELIDYWPSHHDDEYKLLNKSLLRELPLKNKIFYLSKIILTYRSQLKRNKNTLNFIADQLGILDNPKHDSGDTIPNIYDLIICGSDQIWRKTSNKNMPFDPVYLGQYPLDSGIKASYAASMGIIKMNESEEDYLAKHLNNFKYLAVREENLKNFVEKLGFKAKLVLDPVFLLSREQWGSIIQIPQIHKKPYIFFYHHNPSINASILVDKLAKKYNFDIIEINSKVLPFKTRGRYKNSASPSEFLDYLANAKFVVSTSFHGTAFAIVFNKQFYALGMDMNAERTKTLLRNIGLEDRYIASDNEADLQPIKYDTVNRKLALLKKDAYAYIKGITK